MSCLFNDFGLKCLLRSTDMHEIDYTFLFLICFIPPSPLPPPPPSNLEEGGMHCTNLVWTLYINIHVRGIFVFCFLKLITIALNYNLSHMLCRHPHKYKRIYLNHWPKNLINKYIHYKSNVLSTFSWLEPVLTPALDIGIAKSGSNLVHSPPSCILCLTPCVKARKSFHSVLPCLVVCTIKLIWIAKVSVFLKI